MATVVLESFERYGGNRDAQRLVYPSAGTSLSTTHAKDGAYSLGAASGQAFGRPLTGISGTTVGFECWVYYTGERPAQNGTCIGITRSGAYDGFNGQCMLGITTDNKVLVARGLNGGTTLQTSAACLNTDQWNRIQGEIVVGNSGSWNVYVNGVQVLVGTGDTQSGPSATIGWLHLGLNQHYWIDSIHIWDSSGTENNSLVTTPRIVRCFFPTADGANTGLTPSTGSSHFGVIDELPPNGDTDYDGGSANAKDTYEFDVSALSVFDVYSIAVNAYHRSDSGATTAETLVRLAGTDYSGSSTALTTSYSYPQTVFNVLPSDSSAWDYTALSGSEIGWKATGTAARVSQLTLEVLTDGLSDPIILEGALDATGDITGDLTISKALRGALDGIATVVGALTAPGAPSALVGLLNGIATISGSLLVGAGLSASIIGTATITGSIPSYVIDPVAGEGEHTIQPIPARLKQRLLIDNKNGGHGGGLRNYTRNLMDRDQFFEHELNKPAKFNFMLQDVGDSDFVIPTRGSYVTFEDPRWQSRDRNVPDGLLWSGYISDDPEPILLGAKDISGHKKVWAFHVSCTSEDYLAQIKEVPAQLYIDRTRGYIIRDVLQRMFKDSDVFPYDLSGIRDGGTERVYQTDRTIKFADLVAGFAAADDFRYRVLHGKFFYEPMAVLQPPNGDPSEAITVDESDPRYTPSRLTLERIATSVVNDITIFGQNEPTTYVKERWISDGYNGEQALSGIPYGVIEQVLINDDFTGSSFDTGLWQEADDNDANTGEGDGSYLQLFEGALNVVGGPDPAGFLSPTVYLRARRAVELAGILEFRDCELYFPPTPTGKGLIGGLFNKDVMSYQNCLSGWWIDVDNRIIVPIASGDYLGRSLDIDITKSYVLRRTLEFDQPIGIPVTRKGPLETEVVYGEVLRINGVTVTYAIDVIDTTDPQNVLTTHVILATQRLNDLTVAGDAPDVDPRLSPQFAIYAAIITYNLHCVMNFCKVMRPQQAKLRVNDIPIKLGDFMDGGYATIVSDDQHAKLAWYSVPIGATPTDPGTSIIIPSAPQTLWKLGDPTINIADSGVTGLTMTADPGVIITTGAPGDTDGARLFPGSPNAIRASSGLTMPGSFSIVAWVKTTAANGAIFSKPSAIFGYAALMINNGRLSARLEYPEVPVTGAIIINDGNWHHVAWTHTNSLSKVYVDGVLDNQGTLTQSTFPSTGWTLGYDNAYWPTLDAFIETYLVGALDEVAMYGLALTANEVGALFQSASHPASNPGSPVFNPQTGVTVPPQGSVISLEYYQANKSFSRLRNTDSIAYERARFGDDGIRQATILADETNPSPRTSEECEFLAQAFLADRSTHRYEGSYSFPTGERDRTRLIYFPEPGDLIPITFTMPTGEVVDTSLPINKVSSQFQGEGLYDISMDFGPRNRFDEAQRKLMLARSSSLDEPEIKDQDLLTVQDLNAVGYARPDSPSIVTISNVTPLTFTVNMNPVVVGGNSNLRDGVVGYEIRRDNTGWGKANYVARVSSSVFTLNRGARDKAYYVRPFNDHNVYSRNSALVRVIAPLSNTLVASGLDGDISSDTIRLFIPIARNPDVGGYFVQKDDANGAVLYLGDGITHRQIVSGANVLVENNRLTLMLPISTGAYTVRVLVYNILNQFGPETIFTITRPAPAV